MQPLQEALAPLPDSVLWNIARLLPADRKAHRSFCLGGSSWRNAYCSSRQAITLHLGRKGPGGLASRVLAGSGSMVTRLEVRMHGQGRAQRRALVAALHNLPMLQVLVLANNRLGTKGIAALAPARGALVGLRELDLQACDLGKGAAALLASALPLLTSLQRLDLSHNEGLGDAGAEALAPAIQQLTGLLSLGLVESRMVTAPLCHAVQHLTCLQQLSFDIFDYSDLYTEDIEALGQALGQLGRLQDLAIACTFMDPEEGIGPLAPAIGRLTGLRRLRFSGADEGGLSAQGFSELALALACLTGLQQLQLDFQREHGAGDSVQLAHALTGMTGLQLLELSFDELSWSDAALALALQQLTGLRHLGLAGNGLRAEAVGVLAPALARLTGLQHLGLGQNHMGDTGMELLAPAIAGMAGLLHLDLSWSAMETRGAEALAAALTRTTALRHLDLSANKMGAQAMEVLAPALARLGGLQHLNLGANARGALGLVALAPALSRLTELRFLDLGADRGARLATGQLDATDDAASMQGAAALGPALAQLTGLTHLHLQGVGLGPLGVAALAPVLEQLNNLTGLQRADLH